VNIHDVFHGIGVTARHRDGHGNAAPAACRKYKLVALGKARLGQTQASEPIAAVWVSAGQVKDKVRVGKRDLFREGSIQDAEIVGIFSVIGQGNIEISRGLAERKVPIAVHGKGEHRGILVKDGCRPVSLVDVAIDNDDATHPSFMLERPRGDRYVVEYTKALPCPGKGVMCSTREIGCDTVFERRPGGRDRTPCRAARPRY
jgi:hypothetical protein